MGKDLNQCNFTGRLGKDPEITYTQAGTAIAKFSIAVDSSYKNSDGEKMEKVEWLNLTAWKKLAEIIGQYLTKGSRIMVTCRVQNRSWDDKQTGAKRYATDFVVDNMIMLDNKRSAEEVEDGGGSLPEPITSDDSDSLPF
jgi:single-strand DNA-binding protein